MERAAVLDGGWVRVPVVLPGVSGAYGLELVLERPLVLSVGRLGELRFAPGIWRYFGSARGPGGMRARVGRHLHHEGRRNRWHIDYLTVAVGVQRVLLVPGGSECRLVTVHLEHGWRAEIPGFGSSDCRACPAHLLHVSPGG